MWIFNFKLNFINLDTVYLVLLNSNFKSYYICKKTNTKYNFKLNDNRTKNKRIYMFNGTSNGL